MAALGRRGGKQRTRNLLGISDEVADDSLRLKARKRLEAVLDGDDQAAALRAAQSLYSYRAASPPDEREDQGESGVHLRTGERAGSLGDVLDLAGELGALEMLAPAIERAHARLMEQRQNGKGKAA